MTRGRGGVEMKYKPRQSNFDEFGDEVAGRILEAKSTIEDVKDAIAKEIDEYVDAIIKEHLDEAKVYPAATAPDPIICFSLGEDHPPNGLVTIFYKDIPLKDILEELDLDEFEKSSDAIRLAEMLELLAKQCREKADEISKEMAASA